MTGPLGYLATPYTHYHEGRHIAFRKAAQLCARLMQACVNCYSPIVHMHPVSEYGDIDPLDHEIWLPLDEVMMARCDVLIVAHMDGWEESKGIAHEVDVFLRADKPIFDLDPKTLKMIRRNEKVFWSREVVAN